MNFLENPQNFKTIPKLAHNRLSQLRIFWLTSLITIQKRFASQILMIRTRTKLIWESLILNLSHSQFSVLNLRYWSISVSMLRENFQQNPFQCNIFVIKLTKVSLYLPCSTLRVLNHNICCVQKHSGVKVDELPSRIKGFVLRKK